MAKKTDIFDHHIKALNHLASKLLEIEKSDSPVALMLPLPNQMEIYQESLGMPENVYSDTSQESLDFKFTKEFREAYQVI